MSPSERGRRVDVTVVDDEPIVLDVLVGAASYWGYSAQTARSAEEALRVLLRRSTPVLVVDVCLPDRDGAWLVGEALRRWPAMQVVVVSGGGAPEIVHRCFEAGAQHYLLKPFGLEPFRHALEAAFQGHQSERALEGRRDLERAVSRRTRQLRSTFLSAVNSLVRTLEARHPDTSGHSLRVRDHAVRLARALGWEKRQRQQLAVAAKLHDIGKVGLPEGLLNKPGPLTAEERRVMEGHAATGERVLAPVIRSQTVLAAVRGHHERFDGSGYPDRLCGESIPLMARTLALADCYDALTNQRPYRAALSRPAALEIIRAGAGTQFDPELVPVFAEVVSRV